jgi:trk system potassium uptake protein TrkH
VFALSVFVVVSATWMLLVTHHTALQPTLFEVVSAFATCGLSLGMTRDLNLFGQILIMAMMFWGRLGALTVIIVLTRRRPPRLVAYPEERILIG